MQLGDVAVGLAGSQGAGGVMEGGMRGVPMLVDRDYVLVLAYRIAKLLFLFLKALLKALLNHN